MTRSAGTLIKFGIFAIVMALLTTFLFLVFSDARTGATNQYSAVFKDASRLESGDTVRIAGIRVGTVRDVSLLSDRNVLVTFDTERSTLLTTGTKAAVRYLNLVGDRYLELVDSPDSTRILPSGSQIPLTRTAPALDLDLLLGGLKPVIRGLNPQDVNALSASLVQILQGQGGTLDSLFFSKTSSLTSTLADNSAVIESLIEDMRAVLQTLSKDGEEFSGSIDRLEQLVNGLAADKDPIGTAVDALDKGTASLADLLGRSRAPLAGTIDQLNRLAPLVDTDLASLTPRFNVCPSSTASLPESAPTGGPSSLTTCAVSRSGRAILKDAPWCSPWIKQETGRCVDK